MGKYYNCTRSLVSAALTPGVSTVFQPRVWVEVAKCYEGSAPLVQLVKIGILRYKPDEVLVAPPKPVRSPAAVPAVEVREESAIEIPDIAPVAEHCATVAGKVFGALDSGGMVVVDEKAVPHDQPDQE